jgi:lipopolysaccharide heptosyltransferase I
MDRILLVRLGALGDIIHALPVAAALRDAFPSARLDWLVSARHKAILDCVPVIDRRLVLERPASAEKRLARPRFRHEDDEPVGSRGAWRRIALAIGELRESDYDIAFDLQGLIKSAVLARSSGARRVVGFATPHLRERWAHVFYSETCEPPANAHVIDKNLSLLGAVGLHNVPKRFPLEAKDSDAVVQVREDLGGAPFALMNPGAGWPNKRWPPEWFAALADKLHTTRGMETVVLWGPGEEMLARHVVEVSREAARLAPPTEVADIIGLARAAAVFISGDTGPVHIAAAVGTPVVGIYGPTNPARNGPWLPADESVSRYAECKCHYRRRCRLEACCLLDITVDQVVAAVERRLAIAEAAASDVKEFAQPETVLPAQKLSSSPELDRQKPPDE